MIDVFAQVKMCKRNHCPSLISDVLFVTVVLFFCLKRKRQSLIPLKDRNFKLLNSTVTEENLLFVKLSLAGSDKLNTIYLCRIVTLVMALDPANQAG